MKKLILKTAFITLGVAVVLAVAVFGILSFAAPAPMMRLSLSLGLERAAADYAYKEYERSHDLSYLARSFELYAVNGFGDKTADKRFGLLYGDEGFAALCEERDAALAESDLPAGVSADYRAYVVGLGVCVRYRLAADEAAKEAAASLALTETAHAFPAGNPSIALALEAVGAKDGAFCAVFAQMLGGHDFEKTDDLTNILSILEENANE